MALTKQGYSKYLLPILLYGNLTSIIQAMIYIILNSLGLATYSDCVSSLPGDSTIGSQIGLAFKLLYFTDESCFGLFNANRSIIMDSYAIMVCNAVYLALSVIWLVTAVVAAFNVNKWDNIEKTYRFAIPWIVMTFLICIMDFVVGILFGIDLDTVQALPPAIIEVIFLPFFTGILMTVAFRGFVIWIFNFWVAIHVILGIKDVKKAIRQEKMNNNVHNTVARGPITAYDNNIEERSKRWLSNENQIARPHLQSTTSSVPNMYGRSDSYHGVYNQGYVGQETVNNQRMRAPQDSSANHRPWERDNIPPTPRPDYSPQPIRPMRSALKSVPATSSNHYLR